MTVKGDRVVVRFGTGKDDVRTFPGRGAADLRTWLNSRAVDLREATAPDPGT